MKRTIITFAVCLAAPLSALADELEIEPNIAGYRNFLQVWQSFSGESHAVESIEYKDRTEFVYSDYVFLTRAAKDNEYQRNIYNLGVKLELSGKVDSFEVSKRNFDPSEIISFSQEDRETSENLMEELVSVWATQPASNISIDLVKTGLANAGFESIHAKGGIGFARAYQQYESMQAGYLGGYRNVDASTIIAFLENKVQSKNELGTNDVLGWSPELSSALLKQQVRDSRDPSITTAMVALYAKEPKLDGLAKALQLALTNSGEYFGPIDDKRNEELAYSILTRAKQYHLDIDKSWHDYYALSDSTDYRDPYNVAPMAGAERIFQVLTAFFLDHRFNIRDTDARSGRMTTDWLEDCFSSEILDRCRFSHRISFQPDYRYFFSF